MNECVYLSPLPHSQAGIPLPACENSPPLSGKMMRVSPKEVYISYGTLWIDVRNSAASAQGVTPSPQVSMQQEPCQWKTSLPASFLCDCFSFTLEHRWEIDEQDAMCVFHKTKALQVQLNLGDFTGRRVEEVKGIFEDFLTCKKIHSFKLSLIFFVKESN